MTFYRVAMSLMVVIIVLVVAAIPVHTHLQKRRRTRERRDMEQRKEDVQWARNALHAFCIAKLGRLSILRSELKELKVRVDAGEARVEEIYDTLNILIRPWWAFGEGPLAEAHRWTTLIQGCEGEVRMLKTIDELEYCFDVAFNGFVFQKRVESIEKIIHYIDELENLVMQKEALAA